MKIEASLFPNIIASFIAHPLAWLIYSSVLTLGCVGVPGLVEGPRIQQGTTKHISCWPQSFVTFLEGRFVFAKTSEKLCLTIELKRRGVDWQLWSIRVRSVIHLNHKSFHGLLFTHGLKLVGFVRRSQDSSTQNVKCLYFSHSVLVRGSTLLNPRLFVLFYDHCCLCACFCWLLLFEYDVFVFLFNTRRESGF